MTHLSDPSSLEVQWELARSLPAPRRVKRRGATWFASLVYFLVFVPFPSYAAWSVASRCWQVETLRSRGVPTVGRIVGSKAVTDDGGGGSTTTYVDYEFVVDGRTYRFQTSRSGWHTINEGNAPVIYLPSNPEVATSPADLATPLMETDYGFLAFMGGFMGLMGIPFGLLMLRPHRRHRRLMSGGATAEATIDAVLDLTDEKYRVSYTFLDDGRERKGAVVVDAAGADRIRPGQRLTMLYDPLNPDESDLFFAAVESYLIVPETDAPR